MCGVNNIFWVLCYLSCACLEKFWSQAIIGMIGVTSSLVTLPHLCFSLFTSENKDQHPCPPTSFPPHPLSSRRASLSVRITDKNGDRAEAGKIWENQIFAVKMGLHRPKCTQMYESICQGFRNIWRNWFSFIFQDVATGFLKVIFQFEQFAAKCTKQHCLYIEIHMNLELFQAQITKQCEMNHAIFLQIIN